MNTPRFKPRLAQAALSVAPSALLAAVLGAVLGAVPGLSTAAAVAFHAVVDGSSQIVAVVDPTGPVVQVQTLACGTGSFGPLIYHSGDLLNLATGQGSGSNRFVAADGDELLGSFTVQMVPGLDPSLFDLLGTVTFTGGTGDFLGATGSASFLGRGQFVSPSEARTHFEFAGRLNTVPEPASTVLVALGLAWCGWAWRRPAQQA